MTQDEIIEMARVWLTEFGIQELRRGAEVEIEIDELEAFAKLVAAKEREVLEAELLNLKKGVAANSDYIQGRWDLIGEFQDIIRARGEA